MKIFYTLLAVFCVALQLHSAPLTIAANGEAAGHIAIDVNAPRAVKFAARELQNYLRKITTARYAVQHNCNGWKETIFILGTKDCPIIKPFMNGKIAAEVKKLKFDGYAVFRRSNKIIIIGNDDRAVLNGVHRFIYKHTDFIWVRPYKELAIHSVDPDLKLEIKDYIDNPAFYFRGWGANGNIAIKSEEYFMYVSRLCNNKSPGSHIDSLLGRMLDHGLVMEFGGGHNMSSRWLPKKKYGQTNPEYYMMLDGKRRTTGRVNLCYTNTEMTKTFIKETLEIARKLPDYYETINIMIDDTQAYCECSECMKPIELPDGRVLERKHEAFKSTQFYMFLNQVARAVAKEIPRLQVKCFGYFFTAVPPEIPVEKNIRISFCPYVRNDKETLHGPSNAKWLARTKKYASMSPGIIWREYYYSGAGFPRAQANIIAQDLRFINSLGVNMIYSELSWADRPDFLRDRPAKEHCFFDITGPEFWTINMLFWDPAEDPDALRNEYIKRTYREGAPGVLKFYKLIRDSWLNDPTPSRFNSNFRVDMGHYVVNKKLVAPCRAALAEGLKTVKDPRSKKQLEQLIATFESWLKLAEAGKVSKQSVTKTDNREFPGFDFDSGAWENAGVLPVLRMLNQPMLEAPDKTEIKFMHNSEKLFIGFRCKTSGKLRAAKNSPRDVWPSGDRAEIFFGTANNSYFHLAFNCFANGTAGTYDALKTDRKWNCQWDVKTKQADGEWLAVVTIPLKDLKITVEQNNRVRAFFSRTRSAQGKFDTDGHSSWAGAVPHDVKAFGELEFELE
ncbi:MAG: DUF4838 domain-containing protein [Lentisphaeria bacterium]|nr:DUF4838 domain-containing protein [Lentisphaeria bacterium]